MNILSVGIFGFKVPIVCLEAPSPVPGIRSANTLSQIFPLTLPKDYYLTVIVFTNLPCSHIYFPEILEGIQLKFGKTQVTQNKFADYGHNSTNYPIDKFKDRKQTKKQTKIQDNCRFQKFGLDYKQSSFKNLSSNLTKFSI